MEQINQKKIIKKYQKYNICKNILNHIHAQVQAMSWSNNKTIQYNFHTLNKFGCPILKTDRSLKIRSYVIKKLKEEGFAVDIYDHVNAGIEWSIAVRW